MKVIALFLSKRWRSFVLCVVLGILSGAATAVVIALLYRGLRGPAVIGASTIYVFAAVLLFSALARVASHTLLADVSQRILAALVLDLCDRIAAAPLSNLEDSGAAKLRAVLTNDTSTVVEGVTSLPNFFLNAAMIVTFMICLGILSIRLMIGAVCLILAASVFQAVVVGRVFSILDGLIKKRDELFGRFDGLIFGNKQFKLNRTGLDEFRTSLLQPALRSYGRSTVEVAFLLSSTGSLVLLGFFAFIAALVFWPAARAAFDPPALTAALVTMLYIVGPLDALLSVLPMIGRAQAALSNMEAAMASLVIEQHADRLPSLRREWQRIEFRGVIRSYSSNNGSKAFSLGPIDLSFREGEIVYIAGGNGSGKTTLLKLLTGLYQPDRGEVLLDGAPACNNPSYRELFSTVFSDHYLFDRLLGVAGETLASKDVAANAHLDYLGLAGMVTVQHGVFSTLDLSQGQRKRVALLTALMEDRPILVCDEWAADQDPVFRAVFYREVLPQLRAKGKTIIIASHDDRYYDTADRLITLESGRLRDEVTCSSIQNA